MNLAVLLSRLSTKITPEERAQFRAEQRCTVPFCGLPVVHRVFVGG